MLSTSSSEVSPTAINTEPASTQAIEENVSISVNANSSLDIDASQLIFRLGLSPNKNENHPTHSQSNVTSSTSSDRPAIPDLFGSYVRASASNGPKRFNFETSPVASTSNNFASKMNQQTRPFATANFPPRFSGTVKQPSVIPNLGPEVTIRPVILKKKTPNAPEANTRPVINSTPGSSNNEMFKLLSGYNHLTREVASLKTQLAEKESLIQEILRNFSSEVATLNKRLNKVESQLKKHNNSANAEDVTAQLGGLNLKKDTE